MNIWDKKIYNGALIKLIDLVVTNDQFRNRLLKYAEKKIYNDYVKINENKRPIGTQLDKYFIIKNLINTINKSLQENNIAKQVRTGLLKSLGTNVFLGGIDKIGEFYKRYGVYPPAFITVSPTNLCNLKCKGCYAQNSKSSQEKMDYKVLDKIITEKTELWGSHFTVVSGGEPFLYKSNGKTIIDLAEEHKDNFFLIYTNGTIIDEDLAEKIARVGNISPAISVEGFEKETDERRGKGVHKKIMRAFRNLKNVGVPYGISITAMKSNAELVVSNEFIDYYFDEHKAVYGWIFQFMPIGMNYEFELIVTPEQRLYMYYKTQKLIREREIFLIFLPENIFMNLMQLSCKQL